MPKILTDDDIADFRAGLCRVATERFAKHGYDGVTMRQLADALGCSPKTPYRYFKDKADILATVRAAAFGRFANALEAAAASSDDPAERSSRVGRAYIDFALGDPAAYRIMFDLNVPESMNHADLRREAARARQFITRQAEDLSHAGLIEADPQIVGWSMWAAVHGLVVLKLAGLLREGPDFDVLHKSMMRLMVEGARTNRALAPAVERRKPSPEQAPMKN